MNQYFFSSNDFVFDRGVNIPLLVSMMYFYHETSRCEKPIPEFSMEMSIAV